MDIGRKVRQARLALGYDQQELARAVGLNREAIVNIEGGKRRLKAEELWAIARVLERPVVYFLQEEEGPRLAVVARRGDTATREAKRAELWLRRHFSEYQQVLHLLGYTGRPAVSLDWPDESTVIRQARAAAGEQRKCHGLEAEPVVNLRDYLERYVRIPVFGQTVEDTDFCGMLLMAENGAAAVMLVNQKLLASRANFTMAHEYGHLLWKLRQGKSGDDVCYREASDHNEEMFANAFAAHFLAPDEALIEEQPEVMPSEPETIMALAARYGLSFTAMTYRLQNLKLLTPDQANSLRKQTSPAALPSFSWEGQSFSAISPLYWRLVLEAYFQEELDAARCGEMLDKSALEFEALVGDLDAEPIEEKALLEAAG